MIRKIGWRVAPYHVDKKHGQLHNASLVCLKSLTVGQVYDQYW